MVISKTTKIKILIILFSVIILSIFLYRDSKKTIEILYFTNPQCKVSLEAENLIKQIQEEFKEKVHIKKFIVNMYPEDPEDTQQVKELRDKYRILGVPVILINGKEFKEEFTLDNIKKYICREFLIKPKPCFI